ncbi:uncharacterized protein LOC135828478 [Sycon ciliatum]|uniref:uncharacterized protein LOC135828478 n=1 Tax=Sycon ciliatum TaxID=27933 RepID=UPI0031F71048
MDQVRGEEKVFSSLDRRTAISDRTQSKHVAHSSIFQVFSACRGCNMIAPGTCFLLEELNRVRNADTAYYFTTAAHVIYCATHAEYSYIKIAWNWKPEDESPVEAYPSGKKTFIWRDSEAGWLAVSPGYSEHCSEKHQVYDRYPYDFGVIALRKEFINDDVCAQLDKLIQNGAMFRKPNTRHEFIDKAYLCGYAGEVKGKNVRGNLYWVGESESKKGEDLQDQPLERSVRSGKERSTSSLFSMPQRHHSNTAPDGVKKWDSNAALAVKNLYRHYIDASGGQSGSPIYTITDDDEFVAVAIHVGFWQFSGVRESLWCNVAVRISETFREMRSWIQENSQKAASELGQLSVESFREKSSASYLFGTGIESVVLPPAPPTLTSSTLASHGAHAVASDADSGAGSAYPMPVQPVQTGYGSSGAATALPLDIGEASAGAWSNPFEHALYETELHEWLCKLPAGAFRKEAMRKHILTAAQVSTLLRVEKNEGPHEHNNRVLEYIMSQEQDGYRKLCLMIKDMGKYSQRLAQMNTLLPPEQRA